MSNSSEQTGRQTKPHQQSSTPKDLRTRKGPQSSTTSTSVNPKICRDYIWGICLKGTGCRYKHELEYNSMRATLKFCHNFQNRGACDWPDCTYLHVSRDEENLFVSTGQIPCLLAERYAAMSIYEYMAAPPPPPPPPPQPSPPATVPASDVRFDPSRPPPILPRKRSASDFTEAGTSDKLRKVDTVDKLCNNCIQEDIRIQIFNQELERMDQEEEKQRLILNKKVDDFQKGKLLLRSILNPKWYGILEKYIEGTNQGNSLLSQTSTSSVSKTSTVPRQFLLQFVERVFNSKNSGNIFQSAQSTSRESSVLESLSHLRRLHSASSSSAPDTLQTLLEALHLSLPESEQQQTASERAGATGNGLSRITNSSVPPRPGPMPAPAPYVPSSVSAGPAPPPVRPYYAQPCPPPPVQPAASAPQCASHPQPQPYYAQQYAGVGPAARYAAAAPPYPSGSSVGVAPQYPPTGANYPSYYPACQ